jgi:hypothetical protein
MSSLIRKLCAELVGDYSIHMRIMLDADGHEVGIDYSIDNQNEGQDERNPADREV